MFGPESNVLTLLVAVCGVVAYLTGFAKELHAAKGDFDTRQLGRALSSAAAGLLVGGVGVAFWPARAPLVLAAAVAAGWLGPVLLDLSSSALVAFSKARVPFVSSTDSGQGSNGGKAA